MFAYVFGCPEMIGTDEAAVELIITPNKFPEFCGYPYPSIREAFEDFMRSDEWVRDASSDYSYGTQSCL